MDSGNSKRSVTSGGSGFSVFEHIKKFDFYHTTPPAVLKIWNDNGK
jgi:hypothetical protein